METCEPGTLHVHTREKLKEESRPSLGRMAVAAQWEIDGGEEPPVAAGVVGSHGCEAPVLASLELVMNWEHHIPANRRGQTRRRRDGQQQSPQIHLTQNNNRSYAESTHPQSKNQTFLLDSPQRSVLSAAKAFGSGSWMRPRQNHPYMKREREREGWVGAFTMEATPMLAVVGVIILCRRGKKIVNKRSISVLTPVYLRRSSRSFGLCFACSWSPRHASRSLSLSDLGNKTVDLVDDIESPQIFHDTFHRFFTVTVKLFRDFTTCEPTLEVTSN